MASVINLPRVAVKEWKTEINPEKAIWICIGEPESSYEAVRNPILDTLPNLHISFWDLTESVPLLEFNQQEKYGAELLHPPTKEDAKTIVDFVLKHKGKHVLVNCAAGVSRSSAVAQFCHDMLGYKWMDLGKRVAMPNKVLYKNMKEYYLSFNPEPFRVIDKRERITKEIKP